MSGKIQQQKKITKEENKIFGEKMEKEGGPLYNSYVLEGMGFPFLFIAEGYMAKIQKII